MTQFNVYGSQNLTHPAVHDDLLIYRESVNSVMIIKFYITVQQEHFPHLQK